MNPDELLLRMKNSQLYNALIDKKLNFTFLSKQIAEYSLSLEKSDPLKFIFKFVYDKYLIIDSNKLDIFKRFFICFYYEENMIAKDVYFYIHRKYNITDSYIQQISSALYIKYFRNFIKNS